MKRFCIALVLLFSVISMYAQENIPEYEQVFKEGIEAFDSRNYKLALTKFKTVVNMPETSPALRQQAKKFLDTCTDKVRKPVSSVASQTETARPKPQVKHFLKVSPSNHSLPAVGGTEEIIIESNTGWAIAQKPEWCKVMETTDDYLKIWCEENTSLEAREGEIVITSQNKSLTENVHLFQDKGVNKSGLVYFRTTPGNALIEIHDSGIYGISSRAHNIRAGSHGVRVLKEGYETLDTTVVVPVPEDGKTTVIDVALKPEFGILLPEVVMDEIMPDAKDFVFRVNRKVIDISNPAEGFSFDDDNGVIYNNLYKGGKIPLLPGLHEISVTADGYEDFNTYVTVDKGCTHTVRCEMKCRSGYLTVVDDGNAEGADVIVEELGVTAKVGERFRLPAGEYLVEVRKEGYMLDEGILAVEITEDKDVLHKAAMTRMVKCVVSTDVTGETVFVDGEKVLYQQPQHEIYLAEGRSYILEVKKNGYWPYRDSLAVTAADTLLDYQNIRLAEVKPLHIDYDEPNVKISLYARGDSLKRDYAGVVPSATTDTTLYVPYGKYDLKLTRRFELVKGRKTAYKGRVNFNEDKQDFKIQTWSRANFIVLGGDYALASGNKNSTESLPVTGSLFFGQFKLWNGLSTSILKATAFDLAGKTLPFESADAVQPEWTLGASCLFLNYDFRLGGGFCQYGDANLLFSYTWYPPMTFALPLTHFGGHEAFAGVEVSSRIKVFNVNFKIGAQYLNGKCNCYNVPNDRYTDTNKCFTDAPFNHFGFMASVGFSFGGRDAKGRNILRLW